MLNLCGNPSSSRTKRQLYVTHASIYSLSKHLKDKQENTTNIMIITWLLAENYLELKIKQLS